MEATPPKLVTIHPLDDIHWNCRALDSAGKSLNFAIGPREPGKTTRLNSKFWRMACKGQTCIYLVRQATAITEQLIEEHIRQNLRLFYDVPKFQWKQSDKDGGDVTVRVDGFPVMRIISLNQPLDRLKKKFVSNPSFIFFDEFMVDLASGDRYLTEETRRFKELYTTVKRQHPNIKAYFAANIYSLFCPYFMDWKVDTKKLRPGRVYANDMCAVEMVRLTPELRGKLEKENPFYEFDDFYTKYALDGVALNDRNALIRDNRPQGYSLSYVMTLQEQVLGVYKSMAQHRKTGFVYYVEPLREKPKIKPIAFDLKELAEGTRMLSHTDRMTLSFFRDCMSRRMVAFRDLNCYYLFEEIYKLL